ncbi:unnamed protein product [Calypogeia fissa]
MMAKSIVFVGLLLATVMVHNAAASDPDLTTDFNVTNPVAEDFAFREFHNLQAPGKGVATPHFAQFNMKPPFVGLNGLGLAAVLFEFGPESQIDPHTHPRATEMFFVLSGEIQAGFVDTANNFFETTLYVGDIFVFPKGLLHFLRNNGKGTASGFSALTSENPGVLNVFKGLFTGSGTGFPDIVISTALGIKKTDHEIDGLKKAVAFRDNVTLNIW